VSAKGLFVSGRWDISDGDSGSVIGDVHLQCLPAGGFQLQTLGRCVCISVCAQLQLACLSQE